MRKRKSAESDEADRVEQDGEGGRQERDQPAREPGATDLRGGARDLELRVSLDELFALDERGKVRLVGDVEEDGADAHDEADHVELPDRERVDGVGDRDRGQCQRAPEIAGDEDRPARQPVDPDARRQREDDERQELDRREQCDLECAHVEHDDRDDRQRQAGELGPEAADRLCRPELQEVGVAPETRLRDEATHRGSCLACG